MTQTAKRGPGIRPAQAADAPAIARIYDHYILETTVTFETEPVGADQIAARIVQAREEDLPWLVVGHEGQVAGFALASRWKGRCAYRHSAEVSVYLDPEQRARGLGSRLYTALFAELRSRGIHSAIAGIALPNPASIALHEKFGMRRVGVFTEVGRKFGRWLDVGYWQVAIDDAATKRDTRRFEARTRTLRGMLEVSRPVDAVFPLFSPPGEKLWVPGWDPEYLAPPRECWERGQVFRTREEEGEAAWIVGELDAGAHRAEYHRVEPGRWVATVCVTCTPQSASSTAVEVTYRFVGLSTRGNAAIDALSEADYVEKMRRWSGWIEEHFQRDGSPGEAEE